MSTATADVPALAKKSVKARLCNKKNDLTKLRADLRQRCKLRMKEQREELLNQRRFGVSSDEGVHDKLKEIFKAELNDLATTEDYDVPEGTTDLVKKLLDDIDKAEPQTEEEKVIIEEYHKLKEEETSNILDEES